MEVLALQTNPTWEDPLANLARLEEILAENAPSPGSLVVLPEMFSTGFSLALEKTCSSDALQAEARLRSLARQHASIFLGGVIAPGSEGFARNEAVCFGADGSLLARYIKQRPFSGGGEDAVHERGYDGSVFEWNSLRVAPLICYDLRFPELFRGGAKAGVELFVVIAAWPKARIEHWLTLLRARAIENQAFVVGVNRTGSDPEREYPGRSVIIDPRGEILADAGEAEGGIRQVIDPAVVRGWREEFPAYQDFLRWS